MGYKNNRAMSIYDFALDSETGMLKTRYIDPVSALAAARIVNSLNRGRLYDIEFDGEAWRVILRAERPTAPVSSDP